ncbi:interleukin-19-like [Rhinoderma darwinii]|uniref:interleukin-19-like n=1 Tax=Rhinoderma darwinii TaxID=43563 RepID=UPI003F667A76
MNNNEVLNSINKLYPFVTMKVLPSYFGTVVFWILIRRIPSTDDIRNQCHISADVKGFKRCFETLKDFLYDKDTISDATLLKAKVLKHIQPFEQCCFLHDLGNFYVANVFPVLELTVMEQHRDLIHLANSVLSLRKELNKCMATTNAAVKAVGELNILFHWIEKRFLA